MSRSCQSATFSSPTIAFPAHDARQATEALGGDGIALVRHLRGALLAAAERLLDLAHLGPRQMPDLASRNGRARRRASASADSSSACRSRCRICVELGAGSRPRRSHATRSTSGLGGSVGADGARELADAQALDRAGDRSRSRSSANAQPASLSPNVVGSAWTPWVRPMQIVCGAPPPARRRRRSPLDPLEHQRPRVLHRPATAQCRGCPTTSARSGRSVPPRPVSRRRRRRRRRRRGSSPARSRRRALAPARPPARGSQATVSRGDGAELGPAPRGQPARRRASAAASRPPTRCGSWPGGSSGRSRFH